MTVKIVVLRGRRTGAEHPLDGQEVFVIGSAPDAHVRLEDDGVQPNHARIFRDEHRFILMDVSGAGVLVNGRNEIQAELKEGDELAIGAALLRIAHARTKSAVFKLPGVELKVLKGPDEGKSFPVHDRSVLGRGVSAHIALLDMKCSREHCAVEKRDGQWVLVDLGSTNGTRLNEVKLDTNGVVKLRNGDKLRIGGTLVEFRQSLPAGATPHPVAKPTPRPAAATPAPHPTELHTGKGVFEIDIFDVGEPGSPPSQALPEAERRAAVTQKVRPNGLIAKLEPAGTAAVLEGQLEKMGFAQVVQFLNLSRKSGELVIHTVVGEVGVAFNDGNVGNAWGIASARTPEECFYGIARLRSGHFAFHESRPPREVRIKQPTLALLMEAMRLVDEATTAD